MVETQQNFDKIALFVQWNFCSKSLKLSFEPLHKISMKVHKNKEQNLHISLVFFSLLHNSIEGRINSQILGVKGFNPTSN